MAPGTRRLRFWGVRGTVATPSPERLRYGGNTPCAAIAVDDDTHLILDAGTGLRMLGQHLMHGQERGPRRFHVFLSHYHFDHVEGLSLFPPLYEPSCHLTVYGAPSGGRSIGEILRTLVAPPYFPVPLAGAPARVEFRTLDGAAVEVGGLTVRTLGLHHPDGSLAFRIEHPEGRLVYATDHEHGDERIDRSLLDFCRGADVLVYDATYEPAEYEEMRKGWGHSTWYAAVQTAIQAQVGTLALFHHHPEHTDAQLDAIEQLARSEFPQAVVAREGMELAF